MIDVEYSRSTLHLTGAHRFKTVEEEILAWDKHADIHNIVYADYGYYRKEPHLRTMAY